ncbi:ABC transporter substrate-binding protein [Rudaeicoccus suwonensis]|uniref:Carbohydrate ABC transporter substrate-binding protein (CUT1 family) n=1 Tax=Rudaeicoccus suwonensis TaxID=657409 RepID=A0A561DVA4_9MICO|nr:ABC transporter substrate-binding protein [Rudaeicoccus suwonensis]TWE07296.1 carbohydrate ABC transporter substrate-binding protein (CUT1 family) [Rudaeicoccus suwonensis]
MVKSAPSTPAQDIARRLGMGAPIGRRTVLKSAAVTAGAGLLAACGTKGSGGSTGKQSGGGNSVTFGSNYSDPAPKEAFAALISAAEKSTGVKVKINTTDHNTFQNNINSYLQGSPDDLFTWFAGYRLQTFASKGLIDQIDDVWDTIGSNFSAPVQDLSKGADGHYYLVPIYNYPWVVFQNMTVWKKNGYEVPTTWDSLITLCKQIKKDGLIPFAFAQKDGWPALGTFDILDLRLNGYDFHMQLCRHQVPWTDPRVTTVFEHWAELLPYCQAGATGRIWEDAAKTLESGQAAMMFQGTNQVAAQYVADNADLSALDFFVYPEINPQWGQDYMDAPADGFCISSKAKNVTAAKKLLEYIGTGAAESAYLKYDQWDVAVAKDATVPSYNAIQKKSVEVISQCKQVSQFMDRDSDGGFADNTVAAAFDTFINNPTMSEAKSIQSSLEAQAKTVFAS